MQRLVRPVVTLEQISLGEDAEGFHFRVDVERSLRMTCTLESVRSGKPLPRSGIEAAAVLASLFRPAWQQHVVGSGFVDKDAFIVRTFTLERGASVLDVGPWRLSGTLAVAKDNFAGWQAAEGALDQFYEACTIPAHQGNG